MREVEGHAIFPDWVWDTKRYGVTGCFDWLHPSCQLINSRFWACVEVGVGSGVVCHVFLSRLHVPRVPWELRLLVESVVFPTDSPPAPNGALQYW